MNVRFKYGISAVFLVVVCVFLWSAYAPEQWLKQIRGLVHRHAGVISAAATNPGNLPIEGMKPNELVDEVWRRATQGDLLTPKGWQSANWFFTEPVPFPGTNKVMVVSNVWGPAYEVRSHAKGTEYTEVLLGYFDAGQIDGLLRYSPPAKTDAVKTAFLYRLVTVPSYTLMYGPDGKTLIERKPTGTRIWKIEGKPGALATTVNTAIRYVLQMRNKTHSSVIRENADRTLAILEQWH